MKGKHMRGYAEILKDFTFTLKGSGPRDVLGNEGEPL